MVELFNADQISYNKNVIPDIYQLFNTRCHMFKTVYLHKTSKAIEYMIVDMLLAADEYLQISSTVDDPTRYTYLTDGIIEEIGRSKCAELQESRRILSRIQQRDLYKCCDKMLVLPGQTEYTRDLVTPATIAACSPLLTENDVLVEFMHLGYGNGDKNPVEQTMFYHKHAPDEPFYIKQEQAGFS